MRQENKIQQIRNVVEYTKQATKADNTVPQENVVSGIMHKVDTPHRRMDVVRWYEYGPRDGTQEPPHHIHTHVITLYWNRKYTNANMESIMK